MRKIEQAQIEDYRTRLVEPSRPPSRGGNGRAWHRHALKIAGDWYAFLGLGFRQWVYKSDTVNFEWDWDETKRWRNIDPNSIFVRNRSGQPVKRGERGSKEWRTARTKAPTTGRERDDN